MFKEITGITGEIRHGYQLAAKLNGWRLANKVIESELTDVRKLWISRLPLKVRLDVGRRQWEYDVAEVMSTEPFKARVEMPQK